MPDDLPPDVLRKRYRPWAIRNHHSIDFKVHPGQDVDTLRRSDIPFDWEASLPSEREIPDDDLYDDPDCVEEREREKPRDWKTDAE